MVNDRTDLDDWRGNSITTTLEQAEIDELPDDPEELAAASLSAAGGHVLDAFSEGGAGVWNASS